MEIKPIRTKADHRAALKEIEGLMSARPGTREGDRLLTHVHEWRELHRAELLEAWSLARASRPLPRIEPLE